MVGPLCMAQMARAHMLMGSGTAPRITEYEEQSVELKLDLQQETTQVQALRKEVADVNAGACACDAWQSEKLLA